MTNKIISFSPICLILIFSISILSCGDDETPVEEQNISTLSYDAESHVYATFGNIDEGKWEIVLDPAAGQFTKIQETKSTFGGFSNRMGAKELTSFARNERFYLPSSSNSIIEIQDLATFETRQIHLIDPNSNDQTIFPQVLRFGVDENELFVLDTDKSLWKVDLINEEVEKINTKFPISNNEYISNFFQLPTTKYFVGMYNDTAINNFTASSFFMYDSTLPDSTGLINSKPIEKGFGFVQHPDNKNEIYYIKLSNDLTNFRLMKMTANDDIINISQISSEDLPINDLSLYLQTIHSASNTYVLRGGSTTEGAVSNFIYSIDLTTGSLKHEFEIKEEGFFQKLAGE